MVDGLIQFLLFGLIYFNLIIDNAHEFSRSFLVDRLKMPLFVPEVTIDVTVGAKGFLTVIGYAEICLVETMHIALDVSVKFHLFYPLFEGPIPHITLIWSRFLTLGALGFRKLVDAGLAVDCVAVGAHLDNAFDQCEANHAAAFLILVRRSWGRHFYFI